MTTRKGKQTPPVPQRQMTRGQLSRYQREQQQIRRLYFAVGGVGVLVAAILLTAVLSQYVVKPNEELAKVNGQTITRAQYNKFRGWTLYNNLRILDFYIRQSTATNATQYQSQLDTAEQELQGLDNWPTVDATTLSQMVDNVVIEQKAGALGVSASDADVLADAQKNFEPQPTSIPGPTNTPSPTSTPGSPTATGTPPTATATATGTPPTSTPLPSSTPTNTRTPGPSPTSTLTPTMTNTPLPVPGAAKTAQATYSDFIQAISQGSRPSGSGYCSLGCPGLSANDYLKLVALPETLKTKITDKLAADQPKTQEQVHAQHILVKPEDQALAKDIKSQLDKGADFATLAAKYSIDTSNKDSGGDLGWFAPTDQGGPMIKEFSDAAFALTKPGQISDPVNSQFGWHIIRLIERGPRPLSQSDLDKNKTTLFDNWLKKQKDGSTITMKVAAPTAVPTAAPAPTQALPVSTPAKSPSSTTPGPVGQTPSVVPPTGTTAGGTPVTTPPTSAPVTATTAPGAVQGSPTP